ncbi:MAG: Fe-S protein assembly co-chaperone HscB [Bacteroidetes bacterium]|nr:Fe-S protein assembly co-chaperone HscB [Bacteroidota bacterium]
MNDFFETLGIARTFRDEDAAQLERRFHELQRRYHPDHSAAKGGDAIGDALERSSQINAAYRTLRDPISRTKYLLSLFGYSVENAKQVPMDLLELVMSVQEHVALMQAGAKLGNQLQNVEADLNARIVALRSEIDTQRSAWDSIAEHSIPGAALRDDEKKILETLTRSLATRAYLQTLHDTLSAAKEGRSLVLKH